MAVVVYGWLALHIDRQWAYCAAAAMVALIALTRQAPPPCIYIIFTHTCIYMAINLYY
jgi:hypothetical protein